MKDQAVIANSSDRVGSIPYNINLFEMSKCPTILMDYLYPFGAISDHQAEKHLVKKKLSKAEGQL